MLRRIALLTLLCAPALAAAETFSAEIYGGYNRTDALSLKGAPAALTDKALLKSANTHFGVLGTLKLLTWRLGALAELGLNKGSTSTTTVGAVIGPGFALGPLHLEALGELGGRRYGNYLNEAGLRAATREAWLVYLGLRPGLSYRFGAGGNFFVGVWAFARWDVTSKDVPVTVTPANGAPFDTKYKLGGSTYGVSLRLGIAL